MKLWFNKGVWKRKNTDEKIRDLSFSDIKKIAILRHAALGDMVLTRSFIIEARKAFPNAVITLSVVSNYTRGTPEDLVDRVHIVYGSDKKNISFKERYRRIKELGNQDKYYTQLIGQNLAARNTIDSTIHTNHSQQYTSLWIIYFIFLYSSFIFYIFYVLFSHHTQCSCYISIYRCAFS